MSCQPPQTPVAITACGNSGAAANVTDAMIGINITARIFVSGNIALFNPTTCAAYPNNYTSVISVIRTTIGDYTVPTTTGSNPYGTNRDTNGLLNSTVVNNIIGKLGICVNTTNFVFTKENIAACNMKDSVFITGVQLECAYYYGLYKHAIKNLAAAITCPITTPATGFGSWPDSAVALKKYTDSSIVLNQMVNDVIYIMDQVAQKRTTIDIASLTTTLNGLDMNLQNTSHALQKQRDALTSPGQDKMVLYKEMETYSRQKAAYHNNLLALYSFLNITALGLLFYVYRST